MVKEEKPNPLQIEISSPQGTAPKKITKEDVWGKWDETHTKRLTKGMIVATTGEQCPHFGDIVPLKSVTVVCNKEQMTDVIYWLEYVHGAECVIATKEILDGKRVAIRSQYQAY